MMFYLVSTLMVWFVHVCLCVCIHAYTHMSIYVCVYVSSSTVLVCLAPFPPNSICVYVYSICVCVCVWLWWAFCCAWAFSVCSQQGLLFVAACGLLTAVASGVGEHRLQAHGCTGCSMAMQQQKLVGSRVWAQQLWHPDYSCSVACGVLLERGSNPHPLHWQVDSEPLPPGSPKLYFK